MPLSDAVVDANIEASIEQAWGEIDKISPSTTGLYRQAIERAMDMLDKGLVRVAEKQADGWHIHEWTKKAILLYFRLNPMVQMTGGPSGSGWWDKIPSKFEGWDHYDFDKAGFRAVPNCVVRYSAHVEKGAVLMPSFINVGAYVGAGTMVDTWVTIGSCAQIGKNCHISGGVGIGGVIEPLQATPVIIEDNVFVGARSEIAEGVIVEKGSVISMGVFISASTKIVDRLSGEIYQGRVPAYSVVVPGSMPGKPMKNGLPGPNLACAVIVKRVDEKTRSKTSINELLRD